MATVRKKKLGLRNLMPHSAIVAMVPDMFHVPMRAPTAKRM